MRKRSREVAGVKGERDIKNGWKILRRVDKKRGGGEVRDEKVRRSEGESITTLL